MVLSSPGEELILCLVYPCESHLEPLTSLLGVKFKSSLPLSLICASVRYWPLCISPFKRG